MLGTGHNIVDAPLVSHIHIFPDGDFRLDLLVYSAVSLDKFVGFRYLPRRRVHGKPFLDLLMRRFRQFDKFKAEPIPGLLRPRDSALNLKTPACSREI